MDTRAIALAIAISVRLYGNVTVEPELMARAEQRVEAILGRSGIAVRWRNCMDAPAVDSQCNAPATGDAVVLRLLPRSLSMSADACGIALVPQQAAAHFATIWVDCVNAAADRLRIGKDVVMGVCLAHEIGHLLLGSNSHGSTGVMQAQPRPIDWERAAHDALGFTSEESARLQRSIAGRLADLPFDSR